MCLPTGWKLIIARSAAEKAVRRSALTPFRPYQRVIFADEFSRSASFKDSRIDVADLSEAGPEEPSRGVTRPSRHRLPFLARIPEVTSTRRNFRCQPKSRLREQVP